MSSSKSSRVQPLLRRFAGDEGGAAIVLIAAALVVLVGAAGLAYDSGRGYMVNARLSQAVDAAALAGGRSLTAGGGGDYAAQITKYFEANFPQGYMGANVSTPTVKLNADGNQVTVSASATIDTTLMRALIDNGQITVSARATVNRTVKGLEVALVLDNSGSMDGSKMGSLKDSAKLLLDIMYGPHNTVDDLHVSVVPFSGRSNLVGHTGVHPIDPPNSSLICLDPRSEPYNTDDASPVEMPFDHYSGTYAPPHHKYDNKVCPAAPILELEQSKSRVEASINGMEAKGCTRFDIGALWGWRAISPRWEGFWGAAGMPLDYGDPLMEKAIIIMTDGANTPDCLDDPLTRSQTETMFSSICSDMKANGIVIYTITFQLSHSGTKTLFRNCASGTERYFDSPNSDELESAFTIIANDLSTLRLSH